MAKTILSLAIGRALADSRIRSLDDTAVVQVPALAGTLYGDTRLVNPPDGVELAQGLFNATMRDYARLGEMLADDGVVQDRTVVPLDDLLDMTDASRQPAAFRPGTMDAHGSHYFGYGYQVWLLPGDHRSFVLLGVHGQAIYVDPLLKLVLVNLAVGEDARGDASGAHLARERDALWRGGALQGWPEIKQRVRSSRCAIRRMPCIRRVTSE
jgi:CubicO group peptidase (beta-lactamase class C family)